MTRRPATLAPEILWSDKTLAVYRAATRLTEDRFDMTAMTACRASLVALTLSALALTAAPAAAQSDDEELLNELMAVVDEGTAVATQTRMNVDYVPGMVTVLEGSLLASLGARTVLDAMGLVPGVMSYVGNAGEPFLLVRGVAFPFNSGNVKVLVNSIAMSREGAGVSSSVMHMPIEQVERIEFVRGPGSVLYGDFAYMGLLNIVTRTDGAGVFARAQEGGNVTAGGRAGHVSADKATRFNLTASGTLLPEPEVPRPPSGATAGGDDQREFATLAFAHRGFAADLQTVNRRYGQASGAVQEDEAQSLQLRQSLQLAPALGAVLHLSGLRNDSAAGGSRFRGDLYDVGGTLEWRALARHVIVTKATYTLEDIHATRFQPAPPPPPAPPPAASVRRDLERRYYGIAIQDQYSVLANLEITAGARYDRREDIDDDRVTPRLAAVLRLADAHILKAQYAEGYRAPTFFELYPGTVGQSNLDLEPVATTELSYIHRGPQRAGRLTLFHSELDDMIFTTGPGTFGNAGAAESTGAEAEFEHQLTPTLKWLANVSYADSWSTRNAARAERPDAPAAEWLGNVVLAYRPMSRLLLGTHLNYVGERNTPIVGEEFDVALTATLFDLFTHGFTARLGLRNAGGDELRTVIESPTGVSVRSTDDRVVSLHLGYDF